MCVYIYISGVTGLLQSIFSITLFMTLSINDKQSFLLAYFEAKYTFKDLIFILPDNFLSIIILKIRD